MRYVEMVTVGDGFLRSSASLPMRTRESGGPLDPEKDRAIASAVYEVLADVGYSGFTMDEVALAAGVGKAAIYRRWSSKVDLLASFIDVGVDDTLVMPDTGSLRGDLVALLQSLLEVLGGPGGRATRAVLNAVIDDPTLAEAYHRGPLERWRRAFGEVFARAVERAEIAPGAGVSLGAEAGPAILVQRWLVSGKALDPSVATAVVDEVMMPLLERQQPRTG
jgi:AcrR family transcriptional regulator